MAITNFNGTLLSLNNVDNKDMLCKVTLAAIKASI